MSKTFRIAACVTATTYMFAAGAAMAQTNAVANGEWSNAATWSAGVPDSGVFGGTPLHANINGGFEVSLNTFGNHTNLLDVGTIAGETGTLTMSGGDLTITDPDAAAPNIPSIRLGQVEGSTGIFNLSGGEVFIDGATPSGFAIGEILIGDNGAGTMNMTGGTLNAADEVFVALGGTSVGELNISGGTMNITGRNLLIGFFGGSQATFNLSGDAVVNVAGFLFSSFNPGSVSTMTQTGGTLNLGSAFVMGRSGNATFDHSAGGVNVTGGNGDFVVADGAGPASTYNISGSATVTMTNHFIVGAFADSEGVINQTGGTITVGDDGVQPTPGVPTDTLLLGRDGTGTWNLSAGTVNVRRDVFLGDFDSSLGTLNISGGTMTVDRNLNVGAAIASNGVNDGAEPRVEPNGTNGPQGQALDANGVLNIIGTGGTLTVAGSLLANPADKSPDRNGPGEENSATLRFTLGATGISTVDVAGLADLDGAVIDIDDTAGFFAANPSASLTLIDAAGGFGNFYNLTPAEQVVGPAGAGKNFTLDPSDVSSFSLAIVPSGAGEALVLTAGGTGGIPGDIDADGDVDGRDFLAIQRGLGSTTDQSDIQDFRDNFGTGVPPVVPAAASAVAAVPEPGALLLAAALFSPAILAGRRLRNTNSEAVAK